MHEANVNLVLLLTEFNHCSIGSGQAVKSETKVLSLNLQPSHTCDEQILGELTQAFRRLMLAILGDRQDSLGFNLNVLVVNDK